MDRRIALAVVVAVGAACSTAYALYSVSDTGTWPKNWPAPLEALRTHSRTLVGPLADDRHYAIRFSTREEFEAAWPHILKVRSKAAPLALKRGTNFFLGGESKAGVVVHCPPIDKGGEPNDPALAKDASSIDLVVDGEIVDLNRISLPADTPIIDERFKDGAARRDRGRR